MSIQVGDYVLATRWSDGDPKDPFAVGFVVSVEEEGFVVSYGYNYSRMFRKVKKISANRGRFILDNISEIEEGTKSLWWWSRRKMVKALATHLTAK